MDNIILLMSNSILLGAGLAMDAFSVSLANGMNHPKMKKGTLFAVAGVFAVFQTLMPLTGWLCVHTIAQLFCSFQKFIPWIALVLLLFIGGKMLLDGIKNNQEEAESKVLTLPVLLVQGVATSIDALSVGFTIADYNLTEALMSTAIIGIVTFFLCCGGIAIGKRFGTRLSNKASILGGVILILIGLEIFITGIIK